MQVVRAMRWIGYALFAMAGTLRIITGRDADPWPWLAAYAAFGIAFHVGATAAHDDRRRRMLALAAMVPAMIAMALIRPCPYGALTLVIVASQAALVLSVRAVAALAFAQTAIVAACLITSLGAVLGGAETIALAGFQAFAVAAIAAAQREADSRAALMQVHERTRIARDLHDVIGHDLTALALQLEIATHVGGDAAREQIAQARALSARLLEDVRAVVATTQRELPATIAAAIRAIVVDVPGLAIHIDAPESLRLDEPRRAHCVVSCVQEIITNARRHARGAANVWVRVRTEDAALVVEAHDDGSGAETAGDGFGLRGMRSRLEELGGELDVRTLPAFAVTARLPL
jgi:signal transduction histidine kinase